MTGFQPLVIAAGQQEQVGDRRSEILRLNLGPPEVLNNVVDGFTVSRTPVRANSNTNPLIFTINGGQEGDVLILSSNGIRLRPGGNLILTRNFNLNGTRVIAFYFTGGIWFEIWRNQ